MCPISGLLFSQSSRQQSFWLPRGQKLVLSGQTEKLANRNELQVKTMKIKPFSAGFPFQRLLGFGFFQRAHWVSQKPCTCTGLNTSSELKVACCDKSSTR